ncbi:hypothetical protein ACS0TY_028773 [Phlomoides rotata]
MKGCFRQRLPIPQDFSKSLFILDIGQNDVASGIRSLTFEQQKANVPNMVSQFTTQVKNLHGIGARSLWIHNTGPIGCLPVAIVKVQDPVKGYLDEHGCVNSQNEIAVEYNKQLKDEIFKLRSELSGAVIIYVDMYRAKHDLIIDAKNQGFEDPFKICCGHHGIGYDVWCGNRGSVNESEVFAGSCSDPSRVISWDGVHYTEAVNNWIATRIINGSYSDPPVSISRACRGA